MIKIGLTGSIGMGKTETGKIFSELGFPVYNADDAVHKLYGPGQKGSEKIKEIFPNSIIGYSGHETGLSTTYAAVALGARIIERHITLDRSMWGTDHSASVEPQGLKVLVGNIRDIESAMGDGVKNVTAGEIPIREKLRRVQ